MVTAILYYFIVAFAVMTVVALGQQLMRSVREFRAALVEPNTEAPMLG